LANQSATIDVIADRAKTAELTSKGAAEQVTQAKSQLDELNKTIADARRTLGQVQGVANLAELASDALNDDRTAFDKLNQIADDPNNPLAEKARRAWTSIGITYASALQMADNVPWRNHFAPSKLTLLRMQEAIDGNH
jgi:hypothetical protein